MTLSGDQYSIRYRIFIHVINRHRNEFCRVYFASDITFVIWGTITYDLMQLVQVNVYLNIHSIKQDLAPKLNLDMVSEHS